MIFDATTEYGGWSAITSTFLILLLTSFFLPRILPGNQLAHIPLVGDEEGSVEKRRQKFGLSAKKLYVEGYRKYKDLAFQITTHDEQHIVVPPKYLSELKNLPDDALCIYSAIEEILQCKYTGLPAKAPIVLHTIKGDLTPSLGRINPAISSEAARAFNEEMPDCDDWTRVNFFQKLLRIIAKVSGTVFIGPELCHDEAYLEASIMYTQEVMAASNAVKQMSSWKRPFMARFLPAVKEVQIRRAQGIKFLEPIVRARREAEKDPSYEKPNDMLQWMMDRQVQQGSVGNVEEIVDNQLGLSFAAIHTTSITATNVFYNLAAMPEYIESLREEIRTVREEHGGVLTAKALQSMKKLDSYISETMRYTPLGYTSFQRKVLKGIVLSNGQYIPPGTNIEVAIEGVHRDSSIFPEENQFDGYRYYNLRTDKTVEDANRHQVVSVSSKNLNFGFGRHACPGRFFAVNEIKLIVAQAILNYDMKTVNEDNKRYTNIDFGPQSIPDPTKDLLIRRVRL